MLSFPDLLDYFKGVRQSCAEDTVDRLNSHVTVWILLFFVAITATKQSFGAPIHCMVPAESTESWTNYYHDYCYIKDNIVIGIKLKDVHDFTNLKDHAHHTLVYYQWVPYILVVQAILFLIPHFFWDFMMSSLCNGGDLESIVDEAIKIKKQIGDQRKVATENLARLVSDSFRLRTKQPLIGRSATICYVLRKWLAVINVAAQFILLSICIPGSLNVFWGIQSIVLKVKEEDPNLIQKFFPTLVRCDVQRMELGNVHNISLQCIIMMNFINEKIFVAIYFWLILLFVLNFLSALSWSYFLVSSSRREKLLHSIIPSEDILCASVVSVIGFQSNPANNRSHLDNFASNTLKSDGILLLHFIFKHAGGVITFDLAHELWKIYIKPTFSVADPYVDDNERCSVNRNQIGERVVEMDEKQPLLSAIGFIQTPTILNVDRGRPIHDGNNNPAFSMYE